MNKYEKAAYYLFKKGFQALEMKNGVSVLLHNEDPNNRHWTDLTDDSIEFYRNRYDNTYGGYATLLEVVAWADKQRESDIINLSLEELIEKYKKYTNA